jgi:ring-1,2-phenylacetyl-CoA epoxidase subunit PaaE
LYRDLLIGFLKRYTIISYNQALAYICGPIDYMRMCTYALHLVGMPFENIKKENFSTNKPSVLPQPPDKNAHLIDIQIHKNHYTFQAQYPDTILQAAKKNNITLPYSCEAGKCGNCAAHIINGKVWMSYNEVLTDKDLAKGLTLTCVGYPVEGDVKLEIK